MLPTPTTNPRTYNTHATHVPTYSWKINQITGERALSLHNNTELPPRFLDLTPCINFPWVFLGFWRFLELLQKVWMSYDKK